MTKSMTGFGRAQSDQSCKNSISVEIKSVNNRYLDVNVRVPKFMSSLEEEIRKIVKYKLSRGKVDVFVNYKSAETEIGIPKLNIELAKEYYNYLSVISQTLNLSNNITVNDIAKFPDVISFEQKDEDIEKLLQEVAPIVNQALDMLISLREAEGEKLKDDILLKTSEIEKDVKYIEELSKDAPKNYKKRLENRIKEITKGMAISEERLAMEVAIFSDKVAVDEEITRMYSHISQIRDNFNLNESVIGRKLDFIVQEMNRETNTIGSKSNDMNMTNKVIDIKNTLEKIREQVQNIE